MLQIEELDDWLTFKPRKHNEPKLRQNELNASPNQLKVRDKVSLDAADPHIDTAKPNKEIPLTVYHVKLMWQENYRSRFEKVKRGVFLGPYRGNSPPIPPISTRQSGGTIPNPTGPTFSLVPSQQFSPPYSSSKCWYALVPASATYDPSRSKASTLSLSLRLLNTATQSSSLTLIGQMSPQGISSMFCMRMIEKHRETHPPQYRLAKSSKEGDPEDITDDVPLRHEDPPSHPPPPSHPVHAAASYADISECLTRTYGLMNLYHHRSILLHSHADYSPKLQFKEFIHHSGSFTSLPIL
ncbi:hypothetical protein GOBAR_AA11479 [Gossypium barbadense]|uniref:Uncharacterized protein n=1 Tax=Gossypium barbadense TaxID=3634 RepID=A0A2P5Y0Q5_GOSBA|nr:hypothetical protein GOBAR_AA11479 [Gossypium barbadense]